MSDFTIQPVFEVPNSAADVGMDPAFFDIRFLREPLGLRNFAVTYERFGAGWRPARGHRHGIQEEVFFLVSGRAQAKLDGTVIDLEPWTAVRVPPETPRAFRATTDEDAVFVTIGAPQAGMDDVEFLPDYWAD
ncbi:MAG: cupin domain-containing protein [Thermoleophilia bacterium]|nr:cupin domain-containing protein [Thermoleophilia bacterium]